MYSFTYGDGTLEKFDTWLGVVSATGSSTITVTVASTLNSINGVYKACKQMTSGGGAGTVWAADGVGGFVNTTSTGSANVPFPTLTPSGTLRCYIGRSYVDNTGLTTGQTSGYTVLLDTTNNNPIIYNPNVADSAQSPIAKQNTAGRSGTSGILITATNPSLTIPRLLNINQAVNRASSF